MQAVRVEARHAIADDLAAIAHLANSATSEKLDQRGGELWEQFDNADHLTGSTLADAIATTSVLVAVGTINEVVVGFCAARLRQPIRPGRPIGQLNSIFVEPDARGVGVGESLMSFVLDWADAMDCRGVDSIALPGDRATKNFFESFGLVARAITVHRPL